jgi:ketosteroid isomerase-like protein
MRFSRRRLAIAGALALGTTSLLGGPAAVAESADEASVAQAIEALRKAMLDADRGRLEELVADQLSYGHSSGRVETKAQYIDVIASKKTIYKSIALSEPTTAVAGNNAIVRHVFSAETESDGKPGSAKVGVLQVWQKQDGRWKLLARQAYKL